MVRAVVFDVGETLIRDDRYLASWADWLGVPQHTMSALVGAVVAQGRDNADAVRLAKPGCDPAAEWAAREAAGCGEALTEEDLYEDVRPALAALRSAGFWVGIAGNQSAKAAGMLRALALPCDALATSGEWGVAKPAPEFFKRVAAWAPAEPSEIVYVGDHPANDLAPARAAGMRTAHLRRGPHGHLWADAPEVAGADFRADSLTELADTLAN